MPSHSPAPPRPRQSPLPRIAFAAVVVCASLANAQAQTYPERSIRFVAPFAAGGVADVSSRIIAEHLGKALGQSVVVDNRPGAGGVIGTGIVKQAKPDGYTLLSGAATSLVVGWLIARDDAPYNAEEDFIPVGYMNRFDMIVVTAPSTRYTTLQSLVETMKGTPERVTYGTAGKGASLSLAGAMLATLSGRDIQAIDYKGGAALMPDLLAGRITFAFTAIQSSMPNIQAGKLVPLAIATQKRHASLPSVPTMAEAGLPQFMKMNWSPWNGVFAPVGTPRAVMDRLNAAMNQVLQDPAVQKRFAEIGTDAMEPMTLAQAADLYRAEFASWRPGVKMLKLVK